MHRKAWFVILLVIINAWMLKHSSAQDIVRLELEASNLNLPYFTIPAGGDGVVVFRATEIRGRRVTAWEMIHYDVSFRELYRNIFNVDKGGYFAGWKTGKNYVNFLFFHDQPLTSGDIVIYDLKEKKHVTKRFRLEGHALELPVFRVAGSDIFLCGISRSPAKGMRKIARAFGATGESPELVCISGSMSEGELSVKGWKIPGLEEIMYAAPDNNGLIVALSADEGKYMRKIMVFGISGKDSVLNEKGILKSTPERYFTDVCIVKTDKIPYALAGTYGSAEKRYWDSDEPFLATGFFFATLVESSEASPTLYPFSTFRHLVSAGIRSNARDSQTNVRRGQRDQMAFRVLLHEKPYVQNDNLIIVGETYYPEYEYDNRMQSYYMPYSFYGYYPGFYDTGGRWVFKGFRYQHAIVVAFDQEGRIVWENSFEASNILDKQLITRLSLLPFSDEVVLVYAHEGRVWFRVIRANEVVVDKESYPVELPTPGDRVRENISMNMARWYDNFFLVWGRQTIRNNEGRSRTVYFCNKLAFE